MLENCAYLQFELIYEMKRNESDVDLHKIPFQTDERICEWMP